jgi:hypothetical protein
MFLPDVFGHSLMHISMHACMAMLLLLCLSPLGGAGHPVYQARLCTLNDVLSPLSLDPIFDGQRFDSTLLG